MQDESSRLMDAPGQDSMEIPEVIHISGSGIRKSLRCENLGTVFSLKPAELPPVPQSSS